ncbi:MAG: GWxTD domain-containing protein [Bernardetiaceae bacterium]|jgi:GWxTD domain-containing protein|nr:GWxTD domain-containing protein [Bernardetiaceae bacterium]
MLRHLLMLSLLGLAACTTSRPAGLGGPAAYPANPGLFCNVNLTNQGANLQVSLELEVERLYNSAFLQGIQVSYQVLAQEQVLKADSVALQRQVNYQKVNNTFYITFDVPQFAQPGARLRVSIRDTQTNRTLDKETPLGRGQNGLPFVLHKNNPSAPYQRELFNHFVLETDTLRFTAADQRPVFVYRLKRDFRPAAPPMTTGGAAVGSELQVDSLFAVPANQDFQLLAKGLYFAQTDTSQNAGLGFSVMERSYPRFRRVENLIEALLYISTPEEVNELSNQAPANRKTALDSYWLRLGGNEENARRMIKLYYQRVEYANRQFTTYKEGWKTDMGMIYIAFGEPAKVDKKPGQEVWTYNLGQGQSVGFNFVQKANQFTDNHFELARSSRYQEPWYDTVQKWRMGLVTN